MTFRYTSPTKERKRGRTEGGRGGNEEIKGGRVVREGGKIKIEMYAGCKKCILSTQCEEEDNN